MQVVQAKIKYNIENILSVLSGNIISAAKNRFIIPLLV